MLRLITFSIIASLSQVAYSEVNCTGVTSYDKTLTAAVPCEDAKQAMEDARDNLKECKSCGAKGEAAADVCVSDHKLLIADLKEHLKLCKEQKKADAEAAKKASADQEAVVQEAVQ